MLVTIFCGGCKKVLKEDSAVNCLNEIEITVDPCTNIDCYDCSGCDEVANLKIQITELVTRLEQRHQIAEKLREIVDEIEEGG